jgi:hypothetical protein
LKLRTRILTLFVLLGVLPVLALGAFGYVRSMKSVESLLEEETATITRRIVSDLLDRYALRAAELQLVAGNVETEWLYRAHAEGLGTSGQEAFAAADAYLSSVWALVRSSYHRIELRDPAGARVYALGEAEAVSTDPGGGPQTLRTSPLAADGPWPGLASLPHTQDRCAARCAAPIPARGHGPARRRPPAR